MIEDRIGKPAGDTAQNLQIMAISKMTLAKIIQLRTNHFNLYTKVNFERWKFSEIRDFRSNGTFLEADLQKNKVHAHDGVFQRAVTHLARLWK